jgi:hypothetical protein
MCSAPAQPALPARKRIHHSRCGLGGFDRARPNRPSLRSSETIGWAAWAGWAGWAGRTWVLCATTFPGGKIIFMKTGGICAQPPPNRPGGGRQPQHTGSG